VAGVGDLAREDVTFINRQGGAGTRVLLDYERSRLGIPAEEIDGYGTEEFTHMAVAVAVASGAADAGLGILSAARALDLDFVPVTSERYDVVVPEAFFDTEPVRRLLEVIRSEEFARRVGTLGGYDTTETGREVDLAQETSS